jgi:hypothetical protein
MEAQSRVVEAHTGPVEASIELWRFGLEMLTLEQWRLTLKLWRLWISRRSSWKSRGLLWSHGGSSWGHRGSLWSHRGSPWSCRGSPWRIGFKLTKQKRNDIFQYFFFKVYWMRSAEVSGNFPPIGEYSSTIGENERQSTVASASGIPCIWNSAESNKIP